MFCIKCGNEVKEGEKFCAVCGAKIEQPTDSVPEAPVAVEQAAEAEVPDVVLEPVSAVETEAVQNKSSEPESFESLFTVTAPTDEDTAVSHYVEPVPCKKKKKKGLVIGILAAVVAVVAVCAVFAWDYIENFAVKTFTSPEGYYRYVENKNVESLTETVGAAFGNLKNGQKTDGAADAKVSFKISDTAIKSLADELGVNKSDIAWLSDIGMNFKTNAQGEKLAVFGDVSLGGKSIISADLLSDTANGKYYFRLPELSDGYLGVSASDSDDAQKSFDMLNAIFASLPDSDKTTDILNRYVSVATDAIDDVEQSAETVEASGVSQDCTELVVTIDDDAARDIIEALLKEFKHDKEIKDVIKDILKAADFDDYNDFYDELIDEVDDALDSIDDLKFSGEIVYTAYVDGKGNVIGRRFEFDGVVLEYLSTRDGKEVGFEAMFKADDKKLQIVGDGTIDGGKLNADYTLKFSGVNILSLNVKDHDVALFEDGYLNGTYRLSVHEDATSLLKLFVSGPAANTLKNVSVEVAVKSSEKEYNATATVAHKDDTLFTISCETKVSDATAVTLPDSYYDASNSADLEKYLGTVDFSAIKQSLISAGVPEELVDAIADEIAGGDDDYDDDYDYGYGDDYGYDYDFDYDYDDIFDSDYDFSFDDDIYADYSYSYGF